LPEYGFGHGQHCLIICDACHLSNDDMVLDCILKHCLQYAFASAFVRCQNQIVEKEAVVQLLDDLMARKWVDGTGVSWVSTHDG